ncbi:MAG: PAS domain-containing protein [Candidatus Firestonebacteria bacterium]|nr:PAS domain-containing protein [Candidatus Firestonebacteria bacterium]
MDITDYKKKLEALKAMENDLLESIRQWDSTFNAINDLVLIIDMDGNIKRCNKAVSFFIKRPIKNILEKKCFKLIHCTKGSIEQCPRLRMIKTHTRENMILQIENKWFNVTTDPIFDEKGSISGIVHIMSDITNIKKTEEALKRAYVEVNEMQYELIQTEKMAAFGKYSSALAHEIKNPLANIKTSAQFCLDKYKLDSEIREYFKIILRNSENAIRVIKESLNFTKPDIFTFKLGRIEDVINKTCDHVKAICLKQNIEIYKNLSKDLPQIVIDERRLEEAFFNFIINSVEVMKNGGKLSINVSFNKDHIIIIFADTGTGIHEKDIDKIFEPFYTTKRDGIGLGLAVSRQIIRYHKGNIDVKSIINNGTEIIVKLPLDLYNI